MCGIYSVITLNDPSEKLHKASKVLRHRGPDNTAIEVYQCQQWKIGFLHLRLTIIDLSENANQPFKSNNQEYSIIYNGEIFNYIELAKELESEGVSFETKSDTEVVLKSIMKWGIDKALNKFNGMWAFILFDKSKNKIVASRDRYGIKPLYYYLDSNQLIISSEIKGILTTAHTKFNLNPELIGTYLDKNLTEFEPEKTYFKNIFKLGPGTNIEIDLNQDFLAPKKTSWYTISSNDNLKDLSFDQAKEKIQEIFYNSVEMRLRSDVPYGVLLSGGLDSSAISVTANRILRNKNLNLFSVVSDDPRNDESYFINIMENHLQKDSIKTNLNVSAKKYFDLLEETCWYNDGPIGSFSNIAHRLILKKAKEHGLKVVLSGQGGDEAFFGYQKYVWFYLMKSFSNFEFSAFFNNFIPLAFTNSILYQFRINEAKRYLGFEVSNNIKGEALKCLHPVQIGLKKRQTLQERQLEDYKYFSIPSLLHTEDRMSMSNSMEIRVPFLDYRIVELMISLPNNFKIQKGWTKFLLRESMRNYLPDKILWRKDKKGFSIPQENWLRFDLTEQIKQIFCDPDLLIYKTKLVNQTELQTTYNNFCHQSSGQGRQSFKDIFSPLALEFWLRSVKDYIRY